MKKIKIISLSKNFIEPKYQTKGSSGVDLHACIEKSIIIKPFQRILIPMGFSIRLKKNYEAQIRSRSGLALKHGIVVLNSPATIDSDYEGEIKVILINLGQEKFILKPNYRIVQMVFTKIHHINKLNYINNERSEKGFGSTGLK